MLEHVGDCSVTEAFCERIRNLMVVTVCVVIVEEILEVKQNRNHG